MQYRVNAIQTFRYLIFFLTTDIQKSQIDKINVILCLTRQNVQISIEQKL